MHRPILIGILCHLAATSGSASLRIDASVTAAGNAVWLGEIVADGRALLRLRGTEEASVRQRTDQVAARLRRLALKGVRPADVAVETERTLANVTIKGELLVSIDRSLAQLSGMSPQALAAAWQQRLRDCFSETYLMVEPAELLVPHGEVRTVAVGGTATGDLACGLYAEDIVGITPDEGGTGMQVRGLAVGSTALSVERGGHSATVTIDVRKWAAAIAESAEAVITGGYQGNPDVRSAVTNAALAAVRPEPDAMVRVQPAVAAQGPGTFRVSVEATGGNYIPAKRDVRVRVVNTAPPGVPPAGLLVSNDPEVISAAGLLSVGELPASQAVRLLYHHKNGMPRPCRLVIGLDNLSTQPARVHVTEAAAGPHHDELFVGHAATRRFTERLGSGHGYVVQIPAGRRVEIEEHMLGRDDVASGLAQLTNLGAADVRISVRAGAEGVGAGYFAAASGDGGDVSLAAEHYFQPEKRITASYTVGGAWLFLDIGREAVANRRGSTLQGNYGVWYEIKLELRNPRDETARIEIAVRAGGGAARGMFSIDGHVIETPLLMPGQERVLEKLTLPPGASRAVGVRTMPEPASSYPVTLIVRSP